MSKIKMYLGCFCLLFIVIPDAMSGDEIKAKLSAHAWGNPQSSKDILKIQPLNAIMRKLTNAPQAKLNVLYHGDDKGTQWANNIRRWLISLGLKSERIILTPDSYTVDTIELIVRTNR